MNEELYSTKEVSIMLGLEMQSVSTYFRTHKIGTKKGGCLLYTAADVEKIKNTDNRRKP